VYKYADYLLTTTGTYDIVISKDSSRQSFDFRRG